MWSMSTTQQKRIEQAIAETERLKAREMRYSVAFRNNELVAGYDKHLVLLRQMLVVEEALG